MEKEIGQTVDDIKPCKVSRSLLSLMIMCKVQTAWDSMISASDPAIKRASAMSTVYTRAAAFLFIVLTITVLAWYWAAGFSLC